MAEEDNVMEVFRLQGRSDQIRIELALPAEVKGLLKEFSELDARNRALQEAKEKRNVEVR